VSSPQIRASIGEYDLYFIWSRALVTRLRAAGARRPRYLAFGYDPESHKLAAELDESLQRTVTFVGSWDTRRAAALEAIADLPVKVFGVGWEKLARHSRLRGKVFPGGIFREDLRRVITSSLASVNILRPQNAGAHNMRTFEVPATGGLLLTGRSAEQQDFFPENESSLMFGSPSELRAAAERLLAGGVDTAQLRARARARVAQHTYFNRAKEVLSAFREL
jgi:hypothetical protein